MCFTISEKFPKPLVAKRDITCYKLVFGKGEWRTHKGYEAAVQSYAYYPGRTTKKVDIKPSLYTANEIHEGYHSYRSLQAVNKQKHIWSDSFVTLKMVIPKGTTYYKNDREYVSERLKCIGPLK